MVLANEKGTTLEWIGSILTFPTIQRKPTLGRCTAAVLVRVLDGRVVEEEQNDDDDKVLN